LKPTQLTELLANIKATFVSFFSILMFVALGVGIFLGISWAGPALEGAADRAFDEGSFHNFQIQFPYGLTDDDLQELSEVEGVSQIEPGRQSFQTITVEGKDATVKVHSIGAEIDVPTVVEGELPANGKEIALHVTSAKELGIAVGDTITFKKDADENAADANALSSDAASSSAASPASSASSASSASASSGAAAATDTAASQDADGSKYLNNRTFKVTALVNSPEYLSKEKSTYGISMTPSGRIEAMAWVLPDVFDAAAFQNGYPVVNVRSESLKGKGTYTTGYVQESKAIEGRIAQLGDGLATARYDDLHGQAQAKIDEAQKQLDDGKKQIAEGEKKLADGKAELETKRAQGEAELAAGYQKLVDGEAVYEATLAEYNMYRAAYDSIDFLLSNSKAEVDGMLAEYDQIEADYKSGKITEEEYNERMDALVDRANAAIAPAREYIPGLPTVNRANLRPLLLQASAELANCRDIPFNIDGKTLTLNQAEQELNAAWDKLEAGRAELDNGWGLYYAGQDELNRLVAEGEQMIADGEKELADAKKKVAENEPKLADAKAQLAAMAKYAWTVMPRSHNAGAGEVSVFSNVTNNLSISMAALFIIVGLLVTYFAVSRIVREQITQIGTKKALGFYRREITKSYLWYSGIAVVAGAIIGTIVGFFVVEGIIGGVLGSMFSFGMYPGYFGWVLFLVVTALELALVLAATYLACRSILKEHAVELLKGPKPPAGKVRFYEKWKVWDRLPLLVQTIVNNCVNDKRRVLSTIVGVAGATALIVTAITLNNDVLKSYDKHYSEVYNFNDIAFVYSDPEDSIDKVESLLQDKGSTTAQVMRRTYGLIEPTAEGGMSTVQVVVPMDESAFSQVYHIPPTTDGAVDLSQDGAWVSQAYAEHFGAKPGDVITLNGTDGTSHEVKILGFYGFWLTYHEMVMGRDSYEREFGEAVPNVVLADTGGVAVEDLEGDLTKVDGFYSITDDKAYQHLNFETFSAVSSAVVAIYLALAALMAIVVLLNLNVMFIEEKKRDLIVLMINGFSVKDAKHYISYDNIVLTILGIIAGVLLGCIMGSITVMAIEPSTAVFVKSVDGWAVLIGILGAAILSIIMGWISLRRIPKFDLTDINKF